MMDTASAAAETTSTRKRTPAGKLVDEISLRTPSDRAKFLTSLHPFVQRRIHALQCLRRGHLALRRQYNEEVAALMERYQPYLDQLYDQRTALISGTREPTEEECTGHTLCTTNEDFPGHPGAEMKGVPLFWYNALANNPILRRKTELNEDDAQVLIHLIDIRGHPLPRVHGTLEDKPVVQSGFRLDFHFAPNEFFSETVLSRTYHIHENEEGFDVLDTSDGTAPTWAKGKNMTRRRILVRTKDRRTKRVWRPCLSFFRFFTPPEFREDEDMTNEEEWDLQKAVLEDFEVGTEIYNEICPNSVEWFTGEKDPGDEDDDNADDDGNEDDSDNEENEDEDEDDDEDEDEEEVEDDNDGEEEDEDEDEDEEEEEEEEEEEDEDEDEEEELDEGEEGEDEIGEDEEPGEGEKGDEEEEE
ncbi:nucleosome assembly protein [Pelomyxa schiedti]|nr:nucleosome assembly protein [Pelomyxa schiedti]